jgi:hypothetical protein
MEIPNQAWTAIVTKAGADVQSLYDSATVKQVCSFFIYAFQCLVENTG